MITQSMLGALLAQASQAASKGEESDSQVALHKYLQGQEPAIAGQKQAAQNAENLKTLNSPELQDLVNDGGSAKVGDLSLGGNPYAKMAGQGPKQAQAFIKSAQGAYKSVNDQLDASQSTLENLNLGNSTGDKLALINEAKLGLAGSGGRAMGQLISLLAGDPSLASDSQKAMNWLQNTPNIPTLQPAQRDAIRESVFGRLGQTNQQHQMISQQLLQQGALAAPQTDSGSIVKSFTGPVDQKLQRLGQMQSQYQTQRQKMGAQNPVSQPSQANANPTTFDRLMSFLHRGGNGQPQAQAPQQAAPQQPPQQQQQPPIFDFDAEDKRRAAAKVQQGAQQPPQGQ